MSVILWPAGRTLTHAHPHLVGSTVYPTRDLRMVAIDATYPAAAALIDGTAPSYPDTDGFVWASRQLHERPSTVTVDLDAVDVSLVLFGPSDGRGRSVPEPRGDAAAPARRLRA